MGEKLSKNRKIIIICICISIISAILIVDLLSKHFFNNYENETTIIPYIINFYSTKNTGAAWSVFAGNTLALTIFTFFAILLIVFYAIFSKSNSIFFYVSLSLILSGAIGNLIDRVFLGYVRDFIQFAFWKSFPIFNIADCALTIGVVCLCIYYLILVIKENKKNDKKIWNKWRK